MDKPLIILSGPTAVGKTELSIELARQINGEIISADSMQIYKYMDIGSAKVTKEEMQGVKHYLVDELLPDEEFNVVVFQKMAKTAINEIYKKGKIPILVGGTGFYIQSIVNDISFEDMKEEESRSKWNVFLKKEGKEALHAELMKADPEYAREVHSNNTKKVLRALSFYSSTGKKLSIHNKEEREKTSPYNYLYFVLTMDRSLLYERIDKRVDIMLRSGLIDEVEKLKRKGYTKELVSMQGLGYKEILDYLDGNLSLEEATYILKRDTRHFAKRQITWFKREKDVIYIPKDDESLSHILEKVKERYTNEYR